MAERKCYLRSVEGLHDPIQLVDNTALTLGRGPITKIKDSRCSRSQVLLVADFAKECVRATQLGRNSCALDGSEMKKDKTIEIRHGQKLDILLGQYTYVLEFNPAPGKKDLDSAKSDAVNDVSDSEEEVDVPSAKQPRIEAASSPAQEFPVTSKMWECVGSELLIYKSPNCGFKARIAAYDLDQTIICTKSGHTFPKNVNDWRISHSEVLKKLAQIHKDNYKIVIFTNQASLATTTNVPAFQFKIESIVSKLKVPVEVYISRGKANYRKPCTGMWQAMVERNGGVEVNMQASFYCGDAAGRQAAPGKKVDFSQADVLFARNLGLTFFTPEQHFLGIEENRPVQITAFDPNSIRDDLPLCDPEYKQVCAHRQELVLLIGSPGSGKTHFAKVHMVPDGYKRVSRDELGSMLRCLQTADSYLELGLHVVVDNTNPSVSARLKFIELAKKHKVPARAFIMSTSLAHAKHNNKFRQLTDPSHAVIGDMGFHTFAKAYEEPRVEEGFTEVVKINFWTAFPDPTHQKLYHMFLLEK